MLIRCVCLGKKQMKDSVRMERTQINKSTLN